MKLGNEVSRLDRFRSNFYLLFYKDHLESRELWFHSNRKADIDVTCSLPWLAFCFVYLLYCFIPAHRAPLIIFVPFYCALAIARAKWLQNKICSIQFDSIICVSII